jgi:Ca2+-binding EF-hand superfamily protein
MPERECRSAFTVIDTDGDGAVAFDEFAAWWASD